MTEDLKKLIMRLYPSGNTDSWNEAALDNEERDIRLRSALQTAAAKCEVNWNISAPQGKLAYEFQFTEKMAPTFEQWVWQMDDAQKIAWIQTNGEPYPILWVKISRAADYYCHFFNFWVPCGDSGYLDCDFKSEPNVVWIKRLAIIKEGLEIAGFKYLTDELAREKTPFVLERDYDSVPDDDPRWDEDEFSPPLVPSTVHECIIGH